MLLFWPLVIPFLTAVGALIAYRSVAAQRVISFVGAMALLATALAIFARVIRDGPFAQQAGDWAAPYGISLVADLLSAVLVVLVGVVAVLVVVFGFADVSREEEHYGHHPLMHAMFAGVSGAFLTGDLFNLYVWFEVMIIASFGLLVVGGRMAQLDGAQKYVGLNLIATVAFLAGVGLLYGTTGALNMADLHFAIQGRTAEVPVIASAAFLIFAFASKAALFPTFFWLPASYHTPSFVVSALFAALLTKVGVYALIRVFTLIYDIAGTPIQVVLLVAAVLTLVVGAFGALAQRGVRRVLGFGVITSVGMMVLGLAIYTPLAVASALFYLFQDVINKAGLFLGAGAASRLSGSESFDRSGGLWKAAPWVSVLFLIPALSLAGVPPFAGFWGKVLLVQASLEAGQPGLVFAVLAAGFLTLFAMGRIWAEVFWAKHPAGDPPRRTLPVTMVAPLVALAVALIVIGIYAGPAFDLSLAAAADLLDPAAYIAAVLPEAP